MTRLILGQRDIDCFTFIHANKVTTAKQLHQAVFKNDYSNFCKKMNKYEKLNLVRRLIGSKDFDLSGIYELTQKGANVVRANNEHIVHGRFKSNSIYHDLFLVELRRIFKNKESVTCYLSENQIQTFGNFDTDEKLIAFKKLHCDAMMIIQNKDGSEINVALEFELSDKSMKDYQRKISDFYSYGSVHAVLYVPHSERIERIIKKAETSVYNKDDKKIYFSIYEMLQKKAGPVTFFNQDLEFIKVN